jgi:hypothetical protein
MVKGIADKFVYLSGGTLTLRQPGNYAFDFAGNQVTVARGSDTTLSDEEFAGVLDWDFGRVNHLNLSGLTFVDADGASDGKFEPSRNLNVLLNDLLTTFGVAGALDMLSVNGSKGDAFKLVWDFLDDGYSYYDTARAKAFVELGAEYVDYLQHGGTPLTDTIVKYAADGAGPGLDGNGVPNRFQSLHDNLLGNLSTPGIVDRFFDGISTNGEPVGSALFPNEALGQQLLDFVHDLGFDDRPYYGGYDAPVGPQLYDHAGPTILWDQQHGLLP